MFAVLRHNIDRLPNGRRGSAITACGIKDWDLALEIFNDKNGYMEDEAGRSCGLWICEYETRLDLLRQANEYTQAGLAEATGIPFRTIQEYCQGRKPLENVSIVRCLLLAKALGCKVEDLIDEPVDVEQLDAYLRLTVDPEVRL